jgi:predicted DNA-binding transcriptional regulator YafY
MRRADRLFQIVLDLGRGKCTKARTLAERLGVSERTVYRDVSDLIGAGVPIEGEPGKGYRLRADYHVPPMMFDDDELQALAFGAEVAKTWEDRALSDAAERILSKVHAALPPRLRPKLALSRMHVPDFQVPDAVTELLGVARAAINEKRRLVLHYRDANGGQTERTVWPLGLVYWGGTWTLGAWCESREDFRTFRVDRIESACKLRSAIPDSPGRSLEDYFAAVSEQFAE